MSIICCRIRDVAVDAFPSFLPFFFFSDSCALLCLCRMSSRDVTSFLDGERNTRDESKSASCLVDTSCVDSSSLLVMSLMSHCLLSISSCLFNQRQMQVSHLSSSRSKSRQCISLVSLFSCEWCYHRFVFEDLCLCCQSFLDREKTWDTKNTTGIKTGNERKDNFQMHFLSLVSLLSSVRLQRKRNSLANWNINYWMRASNVMTGGREEGISVSQQTEWTNSGVSDSCDHRHESLIYVHTTCHNKDGIERGSRGRETRFSGPQVLHFHSIMTSSPLHLFVSWWDVLSSSYSFPSLLSCVLNVV